MSEVMVSKVMSGGTIGPLGGVFDMDPRDIKNAPFIR